MAGVLTYTWGAPITDPGNAQAAKALALFAPAPGASTIQVLNSLPFTRADRSYLQRQSGWRPAPRSLAAATGQVHPLLAGVAGTVSGSVYGLVYGITVTPLEYSIFPQSAQDVTGDGSGAFMVLLQDNPYAGRQQPDAGRLLHLQRRHGLVKAAAPGLHRDHRRLQPGGRPGVGQHALGRLDQPEPGET